MIAAWPGAARPVADARTDRLMIAGCIWLSIGMAVDAWAHRNVPALETFFTPWHALFYSGFGAVAGHVGVIVWRNVRAGFSWRLAAPVGYAEAVVGLAIFAVGGIGDAIWHEVFGVEKDLAALVSPTHLLLFAGITLMVSSPLRAAWRRPDADLVPRELVPALLGVMLMVTMFSFVTQHWSPFVEPHAARDHLVRSGAFAVAGDGVYGQALGLAGFMVQTVLLVGAILPLLRRWRLPFGSVTALLTMNVALQAAIGELFWTVPIAVATGVAIDLLVAWWVWPDGAGWSFRLVALALPTLLWGGYLAALALGAAGGLAWPPELWAGAILLSGATGLLLSFLVVPLVTRPGYTVVRGV